MEKNNPGDLRVSADVATWSVAVSNCTAVTGLAYGNGQFVAAQQDGSFIVSSNGVSWADTVPGPDFEFSDLGYFNGQFVGINRSVTFSTDGTVWSGSVPLSTPVEGYGDYGLSSVTFGNGLLRIDSLFV